MSGTKEVNDGINKSYFQGAVNLLEVDTRMLTDPVDVKDSPAASKDEIRSKSKPQPRITANAFATTVAGLLELWFKPAVLLVLGRTLLGH